MQNIVIVILLIILLVGGLPHWGATPAGWGYYPSGGAGVVLLVVLILWLAGVL